VPSATPSDIIAGTVNVVYLRDPRAPEWGIGLVLENRGDAWDVFFESGYRRSVPKATSGLEFVDLPAPSALLTAAVAVPIDRWGGAHHNVYVVELDARAAEDAEFAAANPQMIPGGLCLYVGLTGLSPERRFRNHRRGHKAARIVRRYGKRLLPAYYRHYNPVPFEVGQVLEPWLAAHLRERRFGVWQN
jgi:hypothetical protein